MWEGFIGDLAFDVGANYGQSLQHILAAHRQVVAFEPSPEPYRDLCVHPLCRPGMAQAYNLAISDHVGTLKAWELDDGQYAFPGTHGITEDSSERVREGVKCIDLDTAALQYGVPDFVKVDTEGHEVEVLRGAEQLIATSSPNWLIEFHSRQMREECLNIILGSMPGEPEHVQTIRHPHYEPGSPNWHGHGWLRVLTR